MNPYRGISPLGVASVLAAILKHTAETNPHPQYLTQAEADALYEVLGAAAAATDLSNLIDGTAEVMAANKSRVYASPLTITNDGSLLIPASSQVAFVG